MKKIHGLFIYGLMMIAVSASFISCSDDESPAPVITNVRLTDPATREISLIEAPLGAVLVIQGRNLGQVTKLLMNDYEVKLLPTLVTNTNIVVQIVDQVPTLATNPGVPNTIQVVTRDGKSHTYNFQTLPPPAIIEAVSNELAKVGETITLSGKYFFFVKEITFPGDVKVTNFTTAPDGTWLKVVVPAGVQPSGGHIFVTSNSGISARTRRSHFGNSTGIFMNFDDLNPFGWGIQPTNITTSTPGGIIKPIDNKFGLISTLLNKNGGWSNDKVIDITYWGKKMFPVGAGYDSATAIGDMDIRMEVAVEKPTSNLNGVELMVWIELKKVEYSYKFPLGSAVKTLDGTWYTVSIPLAALADASKKTVSKYDDMLDQETHEIRLVINNSTANDIDGVIAIDNIRIVNHTR
jgi:hypothetical protein